MRIVCLSDTHNLGTRLSVPAGDLLLHAGDLTNRGLAGDVDEAACWLRSLPHRHKVVIAGNHDFLFEEQPEWAREKMVGLTYLQDESVDVEGLRIFGSPWQPWFHNWAFNLRRGEPLREVWARIPDNSDMVITHGPPKGILDLCSDGFRAGCEELLPRLRAVRPGLHLFGHIHEGYGAVLQEGTWFVNASNCDLAYRPIQPPVVFDWSRQHGFIPVESP